MSIRTKATGGVVTLSAVVAHELNNICVALAGFVDLAAAEGAPIDLVLQSFSEVRIGLRRINTLTADLDSLADAVSNPVRITLKDCFLASAEHPIDSAEQISWGCDRSQRIQVDPAHARRAVAALARLSRSPLEFAKRDQVPAASRCTACGGKLSHPGGFVGIKAGGLRLPGKLTAADPLNPDVKSHSLRRLVFAVMVYSVHSAGGHILSQPAEDAVTLLFPVP